MQHETIYGNYAKLDRFPLDCESMEYIQKLIRQLALMGNMVAAGQPVILSGCKLESTDGGTTVRSAGYIYANEQLVYHPQQATQISFVISARKLNVTANGAVFADAYSIYSATECSDSVEGSISWTSVVDISTLNLKELNSRINTNYNGLRDLIVEEKTARENADNTIRNLINTFSGVPVGTIAMWSDATGDGIPKGWTLCDSKRTVYSPTLDRTINVPDLRGKFILAGNTNNIGNTGGSNSQSITLTVDNMPKHTHTITINQAGNHRHPVYHQGFRNCDSGTSRKVASYDLINSDPSVLVGNTGENGNHSHTATCANAGNGRAFSVSTVPYYYVLAFIMKI